MMSEHPLLTRLQEAFTSRGWEFEPVEGRLVIEARFEAHHTHVRLHAQAFPEIGALSVVSYAGAAVPPERRPVVAELLMRLNQQLTIGNFEIDFDAGRVFFRVSNLFGSSEASLDILAGMVHSAVAEMDRLSPYLAVLLREPEERLRGMNLKLFLLREDFGL